MLSLNHLKESVAFENDLLDHSPTLLVREFWSSKAGMSVESSTNLISQGCSGTLVKTVSGYHVQHIIHQINSSKLTR